MRLRQEVIDDCSCNMRGGSRPVRIKRVYFNVAGEGTFKFFI